MTQVLVADQQTIVIGGLRDSLRDQVRTGIPVLADIPLVGGVFGSTRTRNTETELFLFITPTILHDDGAIENATFDRVPDQFFDRGFLPERPVRIPEVQPCQGPGCGYG